MVVRTIIQRTLHKKWRGITEAALLLAFFTLFSQVLGLVRDRLLAGSFGASASLDIYYTAFRIPDIIFALAASLVSVTILIPFFERKLAESDGAARKFLNQIFTTFFGMILVVSVVAFFLMPVLVKLIAPGFDEGALAELTKLSRIMLLSPIFLGFSNLVSTVTQAFKKFFVYALSPIFYNIGLIMGIAILYPLFGLTGLAYGVIIGAVLHFLIQLPVVIKQGFLPHITWKIKWQEIKEVTMISLPRTFTLSLSQLVLLVLVALATTLGEGAVSVFRLSFNLQSVPFALIGVSYSVAAFPTLVGYFTGGDRENFLKSIVEPARQIIFWSIPVVFLFIVLRAQIVRVILGVGEFSWADTRLTAAALAIFILSVTAQSLNHLLIRGYYAAGKTMKPLVVNFISATSMIGFAFLFAWLFRTVPQIQYFIEAVLRVSYIPSTEMLALPIGYTFGAFINIVIMWTLFRREFFNGFKTYLGRTFFQTLSASFIMAFVTYQFLRVFGELFDLNTFWGIFGQGFISGILGIIAGIIVLVIMKNPELKHFARVLKRKFWRADIKATDTGEVN